jgi:hypothetical protein
MANPTTVKDDSISEYVVANGQEVRPYFGTSFRKGDKVKVHHFGGNVIVGVGLPDEADFRSTGRNSYEVWALSGVDAHSKEPDHIKLVKIREHSPCGMSIRTSQQYADVSLMTRVINELGINREFMMGDIRNLAYAIRHSREYNPYVMLWG